MLIKKYLVLSLLGIFLISANPVFAVENVHGVKGVVKAEERKNYKHKTVLKHYRPYMLTITNDSSKAVLLSSESEIFFGVAGDSTIKSASRRDIYRNSRKRDMGRYYWLAIPGSVIAGGITGITFFIGAPVAALVAVGMYMPTDKAVRNNVKISQDLFNEHDLPIRIEPNHTYNVRLLVPKHALLKEVKITNASFDMKKMFDLSFPITEDEL